METTVALSVFLVAATLRYGQSSASPHGKLVSLSIILTAVALFLVALTVILSLLSSSTNAISTILVVALCIWLAAIFALGYDIFKLHF